MSFNELKTTYPGIQRDSNTLNDWIKLEDSVVMLNGKSTYVTKHGQRHLDFWIGEDSVLPYSGVWRYTFIKGVLKYFELDFCDGMGFSIGDTAYFAFRSRTLSLMAQAEKFYRRKPDTLVKNMPEKYQVITDTGWYHETIYFKAEWKSHTNKLSIIYKAENAQQELAGNKSKMIHVFEINVQCGNDPFEDE